MKNFKIPALALVLGLMFAAGASLAGESAEAEDKPSFSASRTITMEAEVSAIDHATRAVTLSGANGETVSFTVGEEARNLGQVQVGDQVIAEIYQNVDVSVHANPEGREPGVSASMEAARTELGAMPGGAVADTVVLTAVVEAIDLERNTFTLRGPEGGVQEFEAQNPENLRRAAVGDLVVIEITQALGVMVERPAAE